jgi:hypothetical protein
MVEDTALSAAESGMLAENRAEQSGAEVQSAPETGVPPKPAEAPKKSQNSVKENTKTAKADSPKKQDAPANDLEKEKTGILDRLKFFLPYTNQILSGLLFVGLLLCIVMIFSAGSRISALEKTIVEMKADFSKREAEQAKRFSEALHEKTAKEIESRKKSSAAETLNRLRDGMSERRLIRNKAGDWQVVGGTGEAIGNPEVVEILNNAYTTAKAAERSGQVIPPHTGNAVVVLKPDGKGGTQVRTSYDFIVTGK